MVVRHAPSASPSKRGGAADARVAIDAAVGAQPPPRGATRAPPSKGEHFESNTGQEEKEEAKGRGVGKVSVELAVKLGGWEGTCTRE